MAFDGADHGGVVTVRQVLHGAVPANRHTPAAGDNSILIQQQHVVLREELGDLCFILLPPGDLAANLDPGRRIGLLRIKSRLRELAICGRCCAPSSTALRLGINDARAQGLNGQVQLITRRA